MTPQDDFIDEIFGSFDHLSQQQKNDRLYVMVDNLCYAQVRELVRCGAQMDDNILSWALKRTENAKMAQLLLDLGAKAGKVTCGDLRRVSEEREGNGFDLLLRVCKAGLPLEEKVRACTYAAERLRYDVAEKIIAQESDIQTFVYMLERNDWRGLFNTREWRDKLEKLCQEQKEEMRALYDTHFSGGITGEKLRETVTQDGMTGFMLAVRAERFIKAVHFMAHSPEQVARADDFLKEDNDGNYVVLSLLARGRARLSLLPALWYRNPAELAALIDGGMPVTVINQTGTEELLARCAQMRQKNIKARTPKLRQGPEGGAP